jgi:hypothetical protein
LAPLLTAAAGCVHGASMGSIEGNAAWGGRSRADDAGYGIGASRVASSASAERTRPSRSADGGVGGVRERVADGGVGGVPERVADGGVGGVPERVADGGVGGVPERVADMRCCSTLRAFASAIALCHSSSSSHLGVVGDTMVSCCSPLAYVRRSRDARRERTGRGAGRSGAAGGGT